MGVTHGYEVRIELAAGDVPGLRFCQPRRRGRAIRLEEIAARIEGVDPGRCQRLVLAASELEHPELAAVIAAVRGRGLGERIVLEGEAAAAARPGVLERMRALGVPALSLVVGGMRRKVHEHVLRDPGGFEAALRGLAEAAASGIELFVVLPLVRANGADAVALVEWLLALPRRPRGFLLAPPPIERVPAAFRRALLSQGEQAAVAAAVFKICRREKIEHGFVERRGVSPCAANGALDSFAAVFTERLRHLKAAGVELVRVAACADCSLENSCSGIEQAEVAEFGEADLRPVPLEVSMGWRLKPLHRLEEHDYKNVSAFDNPSPGRGRSLVRVNGHCQMACAFCFVDRTVGDFPADALKQEIDALARRQTDHLVLSGGEPTLHPELASLIAHARGLGFREIEIQTNGIRCEDRAYAESLLEAGLTKATVSLHSADPARSDAITKMRGAHPRTLRAIRHLRELGVKTQIAHVLTRANYRELPDTMRFLRAELPEAGGHLSVCLAIAQGISDLVYDWTIPTFTEIKPYVREALDHCLESGIGFGGMIGQGGYPPCMLDGELRYYEGNLGNVYTSPEHAGDFVKPERCRDCSFDPYCVGVRRDYVAHHGDGEVRPFRVEPAALAAAVPLPGGAPPPARTGQMARPALVPLRRARAGGAT